MARMRVKLKQTIAALETRRLARARLGQLGYSEHAIRGSDALIAAIEAESGRSAGDDPQDLLDDFVGVAPALRKERYVGQIVPPRDRNLMKGEYKPSATYLENVERAKRAQPRLWTPDGVGNGAERHYGYGRGS